MIGYPAPRYTQTPNILFDEQLRTMHETELKVVLVAIRKTLGWHKTRDAISLTQFEELTGLSRQGVLNGIQLATEHGLLRAVGVGFRGVTVYELVLNDADEQDGKRLVNSVDQSSELTTKVPPLVNSVDPQKKRTKEKRKEPLSAEKQVSVKAHLDFQGRLENIACNYLGWIAGTPMTKQQAARAGRWAKLLHDMPIPTADMGAVLNGYVHFPGMVVPRTDAAFRAMCEQAHEYLLRTRWGYAWQVDPALHCELWGQSLDEATLAFAPTIETAPVWLDNPVSDMDTQTIRDLFQRAMNSTRVPSKEAT